jgi:regulator of protease activity HflC (stomatin/prohibitin superfamily)
MFGFHFLKSNPTTLVLQFKSGKVVREGVGLAFWFFAPTSTIVAIPTGSIDIPFVFNETSSDFQQIAVQGQLTFRITDARRLAELLNFSISAHGQHLSDDPEKLKSRLVYTTQEITRTVTRRLKLREALMGSDEIVTAVLKGLREAPQVQMLGVEIIGLTIQNIAPTPEMAKALEAEARESLQRQADEAIYDRRNAAVEKERQIKESELNTEIAVEQKRRQIREAQIQADIAIEQQRVELLAQQSKNDREAAATRAYALEETLKPLRQTDWRTLMAVSGNGMDSRTLIAMAFRDLADNAGKIGELNISPDLLKSLLTPPQK